MYISQKISTFGGEWERCTTGIFCMKNTVLLGVVLLVLCTCSLILANQQENPKDALDDKKKEMLAEVEDLVNLMSPPKPSPQRQTIKVTQETKKAQRKKRNKQNTTEQAENNAEQMNSSLTRFKVTLND